MTTLAVPKTLHDVLGEQTTFKDIICIILACAGITAAFIVSTDFEGVSWWRYLLAILLIADIAAGSVANLTRGTNDFYVERPINRWIFIATHIHILCVAWALDAPLTSVCYVWAFTIFSATVVNIESNKSSHTVLAGTLFVAGIIITLLFTIDTEPALQAVYLLFLFKVVFSFAVDHYPKTRAYNQEGFSLVTSRDRVEFIEVMLSSFMHDPLFQGLFPDSNNSNKQRRIFVGFLLDMNRLRGGKPKALFLGGRLVAGYLLEPPLSFWKDLLSSIIALLRGLPLLFQLSFSQFSMLNHYLRTTRSAMPKKPHHYLVMVGVDPKYQGKGYATKTLLQIDSEVQQSHKSGGLGLDTENQNNVGLYKHFGFSLLTSQSILKEKATAYSMFRQKS